MRFSEFARTLVTLENTSSRLEMYSQLAALFGKAEADEVAAVAYLLEGRLLPAFEGVETGVGERTAAQSVASATRSTPEDVYAASSRLGDLGLAAEELTRPLKRPKLSLMEVYKGLLGIARTGGRGSTEGKQKQLAALLAQATPLEARYVVRLALGRLRMGVAAPTVIEALARREEDSKAARRVIERAYNTCSDLGLVLTTLFKDGPGALERFKVRVGSPVRPMLAERLPSAEKIIERIGRCEVEAKLDGFRCQVHLKGGRVEIFSRNLERTTDMFPDIAAALKEEFSARSAILDGEALAVDEATGEFHPFQVTVQRKRKQKIEQMAEELPLHLVTFDLLYIDGKDLTHRPYTERRRELAGRIKGGGRLQLSDSKLVETGGQLQDFFDASLERGHEGVVAKRLDSGYEPGARNYNWIKLKRAYQSELNDTVDVCIVGYLLGRGYRARFGIGSLLGAVYDEASDTFKSVCKIGSGLSDENWSRMKTLLDTQKVDHKPARVDSRLVPDVWVEPKFVVTVLADEITRSPVHTAAQDERGRGLALRFPRVLNFVRDDKSAEDATTAKEIAGMYSQQRRSSNRPK
ncbi:MAG: ATP-dependent DNA ligase [Pyrinomonadaceae bacterium]